MSEQHTPGRLKVHIDGSDGWPLLMVGGPAGRIVANVNAEAGVDTSKAPSIAFKKMPAAENARRLAACWNACEGISTETLEIVPRFTEAGIKTVQAVEAQRDALLEALQFAIRFHDQLTPSDVERMRTIAAKAIGSAT